MPKETDPELLDLRLQMGAAEFKRLRINLYKRTMQHGTKRFSGKKYKNSPERIAALKEKYKNGVPSGTIEQMLGLNYGKATEER